MREGLGSRAVSMARSPPASAPPDGNATTAGSKTAATGPAAWAARPAIAPTDLDDPRSQRARMSRPIKHEQGIFAALSDQVVGPIVDLSDLRLDQHPKGRLELARRVWADRARTEFRSIQIMNRFMTEVLGAGD